MVESLRAHLRKLRLQRTQRGRECPKSLGETDAGIGESLAIYHCSVRTISRSYNHSAVAAAAYRSGSLLKDERTGQSHNYRNRRGIVHASIFLPPTAPEEYADRHTLWNAAESAETRKNSRVAREVILALPHELSEVQRLTLTRDMALYLVSKYGVAVDMAIHAPMPEHSDDPRNHHAHLLFTTRVVKQDGLGEKTRIMDDKVQGPQQIELIREVWETLANAALQQAGFEAVKIDRRTLEAQGIDRIPQEHVGKVGTHGEASDNDPETRLKEDEEDEDGETEAGKAGSGDSKGLTPSAAQKEPSSSKKEKAASLKTRAETRLGLNEEIKRLNAQRAAFSPVPLKNQIKELDRLIDRLDGRVQRLKLLSEKTSLPARVLSLVKSAISIAKSLIVVRTKDEAVSLVRRADRARQAERQRARYGKIYRASIRERMTEMRENMEILQARKTQYYNYKQFVEMVEQRVKLVYSTLKAPALPARTEWKATTTPQNIKAKIVTEAIKKREKIPIEYRPTLKQELLAKNFKTALASSTSTVAISHPTKPIDTVTKGEHHKRREKFFTAATTTPLKDNAARTVWHKEVTIQIRSLEQARAERTPIKSQEPMDSAKVWKVEANEKGKVILERMQADIRERKAEMPKANPDGFSGRFNNPSKSATDEAAIQKVKIEAKAARAKIPPDMRAEPYGDSILKASKPNSGFSNSFKTAGQAALKEKSTKMSWAFNRTSRASDPPTEPAPQEPRADI
ncbi:MAG: hypothetical protein DI551_07675 [Micavibrio aeruginosavorus]|uniref:MobA/MobL protein domain-containing protein n=1 Tax=Micavibrio aeruginosavorus TaxID=349221 RepID=A0A2W5MVK8_9BACT|nr:MAG: hypothetical protein DI551_07675 [Micavibrio aeruginosavorus]